MPKPLRELSPCGFVFVVFFGEPNAPVKRFELLRRTETSVTVRVSDLRGGRRSRNYHYGCEGKMIFDTLEEATNMRKSVLLAQAQTCEREAQKLRATAGQNNVKW